jgi:hypothetical protein
MSATISRSLQCPLADRVEVLLLRALDEAEVVRDLAHLCGIHVGVDGCEHVSEQPRADLASLLEVLPLDVRGESGVLFGQVCP